MNTITITLTKSKSAVVTDSNQPDRYAFEVSNPSGTKVVDNENNSTEIKVIYPAEFANYMKFVDMRNTRSATDGDRIFFGNVGTEFTFKIPDSMTFAGYTFLHFIAENGENERAIWDRVAIKIWSTSPNWTAQAAANPDILIRALTTAQLAEEIARGIEGFALEAKDIATTANNTSNNAVVTANQANQKAQSVIDRANSGEFSMIPNRFYPSIAAMQADFVNTNLFDIAIIQSPQGAASEENAQMFLRTETEWVFISDLSGAIGPTGADGSEGKQGQKGDPGEGVPIGGTANQVLAKIDSIDFNTHWIDPISGGTIVTTNGIPQETFETNIKAPISQPNFQESIETTAILSNNLATTAIVGSGWIGEFPIFTHITGSVTVLSFPISIIKNNFYEIVFTQEYATTGNLNMIFGKTATSITGQLIKDNISYSTTFVINANDDYEYLNIIPTTNFNGAFTLISIKQFDSLNSFTISIKNFETITKEIEFREQSYFVGGGGKTNTTGESNVANGYQALYSNTSGSYNTANGVNALRSNTTGESNVANGYQALYSNTSGGYNTANGRNALFYNVTGGHNTANGVEALLLNTSGSYNTANGVNTLRSNTTGNYNVANGYQALYSNTSGGYNTANGVNALRSNTTSNYNVANGGEALYSNTGGNNNTATGYQALRGNTSGSYNTANGVNTLRSNGTGGHNTANGGEALYSNTSGSYNTATGRNAGRYIGTSTTANAVTNNSVYLGANSRAAENNQTNQIVIGYNAVGAGSNTAHIGNTDVDSISYGAGTGTTFTNRSDSRIKENITDANIDMCYSDIKNLPLHRFKYKDFVGNTKDKNVTGFLSNEFKKIFPKAITTSNTEFSLKEPDGTIITEEKDVIEYTESIDENGEVIITENLVKKQVPKTIIIENCESIDTSQIIPTLLGAVQKLMQEVEQLQQQLNTLKQ